VTGLKIALVSPYDFNCPGGVTEHVTQLDRALRAIGHSTTIIAPTSRRGRAGQPSNLLPIGRVVSVPVNGSVARIALSPGMSRQVKSVLRRNHFDVLHLHEPFVPMLPTVALHHSHTANVATFHAYSGNELGYRWGRYLLERLFGRLHGRIAVSRSARDFVGRHFRGEFTILPNGVDVARFRNAAPFSDFQDGKFNILFVGRLEQRKGFRVLLEAFARLSRERCTVRLIVVGAYSPAQRERYQRLLRAVAIDNVVFVGYASPERLPRFFQSADVVCVPSLGGESFGIVLVEAMAAGRALIASDIPAYREVLAESAAGVLVPPGDAQALSNALSQVAAQPGLAAELGSHGLERAQDFAWPAIARAILDVYERAIRESTGVEVGARATVSGAGSVLDGMPVNASPPTSGLIGLVESASRVTGLGSHLADGETI